MPDTMINMKNRITIAKNERICYNIKGKSKIDGGIVMGRTLADNSAKNKSAYISMLNVFAAFSVVMMHANVSFWKDLSKPYWNTANIIESVCYYAVPVFFMLSGATLIDYQERYSTKEFFKKRFIKTGIPFLAWSVFSLLWAYRKVLLAMITGQPNGGLDWTFLSVTNGIVNTRFRDIYWFFIPLFCVYLTIPLFAAVRKEKRIKIFSYIMLIALAINCLVPFILSLLKRYGDISFGWKFDIYVGFEYLYYVLAGYVIHKKDFKLKYRLIIYALALIGLLTHIIGTYTESIYNESGSVTLYKGYYNLPCVLYSTGLFLFVKQAASKIKSAKAIRVFAYLQGFTFPIYLIHRYFLDVFEENIRYINLTRDSLLYVFPAAILATLLSILLTMLLRKIPVIRRIVP